MTPIDSWLTALDTVHGLNADPIVAGHKDPRAANTPVAIEATRQYLTDARHHLESTSSAEQIYARMLAQHPDRINPGALRGAAITRLPVMSHE
ncbi:hypothetical protein [Nocardia sp. NPDC049707]|uniref:hypothetical protein n=1 Tax=Nocardia sp. NPDC049707 TaxID=3154735 RepID=UPI00341CA531